MDIADVADLAFAALTEAGHEGRAYDLTGPEALTPAEMATQLSTALGRPLRMVTLTFEQAREMMLGAGFPSWNAEGILDLQRWFQTGTAAVTGSSSRTFGAFAKCWAFRK